MGLKLSLKREAMPQQQFQKEIAELKRSSIHFRLGFYWWMLRLKLAEWFFMPAIWVAGGTDD